MSDEKEFVNGLIVKAPRDGAPEFVKGAISIRREELITFLSGKTDDWINLDIKVSKGGKWYAEVNNWKPESQTRQERTQVPEAQASGTSQPAPPIDNALDDDIPF